MTDQDEPGWILKHKDGDELAEWRTYQVPLFDGITGPLPPGAYQLGPKISFWDDIADYAKECDEILTAGGFPPVSQTRGTRTPYRNAEVFSEEWFAAKIGIKCYEILEGREVRSDWTLRNTLILGRLLEDRTWRRMHKADAVRGKKNAAAAKRGGDQRLGIFADDTLEILDEMSRLLEANLSINAAAHRVARKFGKKPSALRSLWYRHLKKLLHTPPNATTD